MASEVVAEILATEQRYVADMHALVDLFYKPLQDSAATLQPLLKDSDIQRIFGNLEDILLVNDELCKNLEQRITAEGRHRIGDVFLRMVWGLKLYKNYTISFEAAINHLKENERANKRFRAFLQASASDERARNLSLESLLIMPVQRIPRYRLLLEALLKHTSTGDIDYDDLKSAHKAVADVADFVNESLRTRENREKILDIQRRLGVEVFTPGRLFVREGTVTKICRNKHAKYSMFLFNDVVMYCEEQIGGSVFGKRVRTLSREKDRVKVASIADDGSVTNAMEIRSKKKSFVVYTPSPQDKAGWLAAFNNTSIGVAAGVSASAGAGGAANNEGDRVAACGDEGDGQAGNRDSGTYAPVLQRTDSAEVCNACGVEFSLIRWRQWCDLCGKVFCSKCTRPCDVKGGKSSSQQRGCITCLDGPGAVVPARANRSMSLAPNMLSGSGSNVKSPGGTNGTGSNATTPQVATTPGWDSDASSIASSSTAMSGISTVSAARPVSTKGMPPVTEATASQQQKKPPPPKLVPDKTPEQKAAEDAAFAAFCESVGADSSVKSPTKPTSPTIMSSPPLSQQQHQQRVAGSASNTTAAMRQRAASVSIMDTLGMSGPGGGGGGVTSMPLVGGMNLGPSPSLSSTNAGAPPCKPLPIPNATSAGAGNAPGSRLGMRVAQPVMDNSPSSGGDSSPMSPGWSTGPFYSKPPSRPTPAPPSKPLPPPPSNYAPRS